MLVLRVLLIGIALLINTMVQGQVRDELIWKPTLNDDSEDEYRRNYSRILKGGFKLDLDALRSGEIVVYFTDLATLTQSIPGASDGISFNYSDLNGQSREIFADRNNIRNQLQQQFEIYLDERMTKIRIRGSVEDYKKKQRKDFQLILKGKKSGVRWKDYTWPVKIGTANDLNPKMPYSSSFICKKVPYASLEYDSLYSDLTTILPQLDNEKCAPIDRFTYFKKYFGLTYTGISYRPYRPRSGIARRKNFRLFFDKASSTYDRAQIDEIVKYINDSNLVIQTAKVLAFASVEGDSVINMRLQKERATVLMKTLEKANNDTIEISMETREDWGQFNSQLSRTPFKDKYSKSEWKDLFENDSIEARFEKYLKQQRRAELYLTLTQRLTDEEKMTVALGDFNRYVGRYQPNAPPETRFRQVKMVYAIKKYLERQAFNGLVDKEHVCSLFPPSVNEYHIISLYETAKLLASGRRPVCENLDDIIVAAHFSVLDLIQMYGERRLYVQQALDIQSFAYEMIESGEVGPEILCKLIYPDIPQFYNLILNKLYYQEHQGLKRYQNLPCLGSYFEDQRAIKRFYASAEGTPPMEEVPDSRYYFVLKKIVLENDELVKRLVERSDHVLQFDILEFLYFNISNWQVWDNKLFDPEVTPEIMNEQLDRLLSMEGTICPNQVNSLKLLFHLKVMHSSLVTAEVHDLTTESIDYVSHYYQGHAQKMDDRLALMVAKQLMSLTPLYFRNEPAKEAYDVLRLKDWKEPLKGEALNYYLNLVNLVANDRDIRMESLERKYPKDVWDSFFSGKYSIQKLAGQK